MSDALLNIEEFNQITGLIFAELYQSFPVAKDLDGKILAQAMGVDRPDWSSYELGSGNTLGSMFAHTVGWLNMEEFICSHGSHPTQRVTLATKGLAAMQVILPGQKDSLGVALTKVVEEKPGNLVDLTGIGQLVGGFVGSLAKTLGNL